MARSRHLELFLAVQREVTGRFAQEVAYLPTPPEPEIARFTEGVRLWKANGQTAIPSWVANGDVLELTDTDGGKTWFREGSRLISEAITAAKPDLMPALGSLADQGERGTERLERLSKNDEVWTFVESALGVDYCGPLTVHLVPLAPHFPGAGFLTSSDSGDRKDTAYIDCRRFQESMLDETALMMVSWSALHTSKSDNNLLHLLREHLPGDSPPLRRFRALTAKMMIEMTCAQAITIDTPDHRPAVDTLGTAWRYPRLFGLLDTFWNGYLNGVFDRSEALTCIANRMAENSTKWYIVDVDVSSLAADFYLLEVLSSHGNRTARSKFERWLPFLSDYFARLLDLIIGSELGHFERTNSTTYREELSDFIAEVNRGDSRGAWHRYRRKVGSLPALDLASRTFAGPGIEYGGDAWAPVADLLRRFIKGEISSRIFVDQCFTLEHNNGSLFDKFMDTRQITTILDAQSEGDLPKLVERASPEVRSIWESSMRSRSRQFDAMWLGPPRATISEPAVKDCPPRSPELTASGHIGSGSALTLERFRNTADQMVRSQVGHVQRRVPTGNQYRCESSVEIEIDTDLGVVRALLHGERAPLTVGNFVALSTGSRAWRDPYTGETRHEPFYDGLDFFRRRPDFLVQAGDRTGTGVGGPGYRIPDEIGPDMSFDRPFRIGMQNTGPNSAGSQFFITMSPQPHLSGRYCDFGEITDPASQKVASDIAAATHDVKIVTVTVALRKDEH